MKTDFKVKKDTKIIYNENLICIDEVMILHENFIKFDNLSLQMQVNKKEPFAFCFNNNDYGKNDIPSLKKLLSVDVKELKKAKNTGMTSKDCGNELQIFYSDDINRIFAVNKKYSDFVENLNMSIDFCITQQGDNIIFTKNDEIIGCLCRYRLKNHFLDNFYLYKQNDDTKQVLSEHNELAKDFVMVI